MKLVTMVGKETVRLKDVPEPVSEADEALIVVKACGVCGSEMPPYHAETEKEISPGHETAGVVEKPGNSGRLKEGDRVVLCVVSGCGKCDYCREGHENYCPEIWTKGRPVRPAGHCEKVALVERNCFKIPDSMDFETAIAVGGCGIGVAWHGIKRLEVQKGEPVAVFGVGPIGLSTVMILKHLGALPIAIDVSDYRLELAVKLGAVEKIKGTAIAGEETLLNLLKKKRIPRSVLCTGNHQAAKEAVMSLLPLGRMLILAGVSDWPLITGPGDKTIIGSWHYHRAEWPEIMGMIEAGLPAEKMVTHVFPFSRANEAYAAFAGGNTGKVILKPDTEETE